jgi:hypothetical protein
MILMAMDLLICEIDGDGFNTTISPLRYTDPVTGKKYYYKYNGEVDNQLHHLMILKEFLERTAPNYTYDYSRQIEFG